MKTQEERVQKMAAMVREADDETYRREFFDGIDAKIAADMIAARDKTMKELKG